MFLGLGLKSLASGLARLFLCPYSIALDFRSSIRLAGVKR